MMSDQTKSIQETYTEWLLISQGSYGIVYKCYDTKNQHYVAIKKSKIKTQNEGLHSSHLRQMSIINALKHPNIIKLQEMIMENNQVFFVFQYLETDLKTYYTNLSVQMEKKKIKKFMFQLISAVQKVHQEKFMHRDIKPENILLDKEYENIKLADFGLARVTGIGKSYTDHITSLWYRAPQVILGEKFYTNSVDIWSSGCVFIELALRKPFCMSNSEMEHLTNLTSILGTPTEQTWPQFKNLSSNVSLPEEFYEEKKIDIELIDKAFNDKEATDLFMKMMDYDYKKRITAREALSHPYFNDMK